MTPLAARQVTVFDTPIPISVCDEDLTLPLIGSILSSSFVQAGGQKIMVNLLSGAINTLNIVITFALLDIRLECNDCSRAAESGAVSPV